MDFNQFAGIALTVLSLAALVYLLRTPIAGRRKRDIDK